jgi:hypothetical protein
MPTSDHSQTETVIWIPVSERLPKEEGYYLITCEVEYDQKELEVRETLFSDGAWYFGDDEDNAPIWASSEDGKVIAWAKPLEGYKP